MHDATVATHALEVLLSDVDDQRGAADGVVAAAHDVDLDARLGRGVEPVPVRDDQRIFDVLGDLVENVLCAQSHEEVLRLLDDLLQQRLAERNINC